jgi:hypothetical protein
VEGGGGESKKIQLGVVRGSAWVFHLHACVCGFVACRSKPHHPPNKTKWKCVCACGTYCGTVVEQVCGVWVGCGWGEGGVRCVRVCMCVYSSNTHAHTQHTHTLYVSSTHTRTHAHIHVDLLFAHHTHPHTHMAVTRSNIHTQTHTLVRRQSQNRFRTRTHTRTFPFVFSNTHAHTYRNADTHPRTDTHVTLCLQALSTALELCLFDAIAVRPEGDDATGTLNVVVCGRTQPVPATVLPLLPYPCNIPCKSECPSGPICVRPQRHPATQDQPWQALPKPSHTYLCSIQL